jgi:uncharacterized protein YyaL (SSP411 family)
VASPRASICKRRRTASSATSKPAATSARAAADANLLLRLKEDSDNVEPSGNSVAARNLLRLALMTDDKKLVERAEKTIKLYAGTLQRSPAAMPAMLVATDFHLDKPKQIVLAGDPAAAGTRAMLETVYKTFLPDRVILAADQGPGQAFLATGSTSSATSNRSRQATAYVCENYACQRPTSDISELEKATQAAPGPDALTNFAAPPQNAHLTWLRRWIRTR